MDANALVGILLPLFFLVVFGGIVGFIVYAGKKGKDDARELARRKAAAHAATAVVSAMHTTQYAPSGPGRVTTDAHVQLDVAGQRPVRTRAIWTVDPAHLPRLQPGSEVRVLIDAQSPARVFPAEPWLRSSGMDPNVQFS